jgi:urate oxidase
MPHLAWNRYGKSRVRLVKVRRTGESHEIIDLTVDVQIEGAFEAVFTKGDNQACLPTDTMKNTVYALARRDPIVSIESFAVRLARHLAGKPAVSCARVGITESSWDHLSPRGRPHPHAFLRAGGEQRTTLVTAGISGVDVDVASGLANLVVLKTMNSAFDGFLRDECTTLADTRDRLLATAVTATWKYRRGAEDFTVRERIRNAMLEAFAIHRSESVQHTLYAMAEAALAAAADVTEVTLTLPNQHHLLVDLTPFGLDNPNEIFVATDQPYGLIEATVRREP